MVQRNITDRACLKLRITKKGLRLSFKSMYLKKAIKTCTSVESDGSVQSLNNNNTSVIADLFPLLQNNQTQPQVLKAIEALGYMVDGQYPDAIQKLQERSGQQR